MHYDQNVDFAIPFPFPYSNAIVLVLVIYTFTVPVLMWLWVENTWFGAFLAFIATFTYWTLNEIARDLEDPFLYEPNEMPLPRIQVSFATAASPPLDTAPPWLCHDSLSLSLSCLF